MKEYEGIVVEESLKDNRVINGLKIKQVKISEENDPNSRWHLYTVLVSENDILKLSKNIKPKWYMHFWKGRNIIAIFKGRKFEFNYDSKETWKEVIDYGLSQGIPKEQLDFPIED